MAIHENSAVQASSTRLLLVNNVCRRLGVSERMVRHLALTHQLPATKIDKKSWGFRPADVEELRKRRERRYGPQ
jgi:Helix-turn-helix domain